MDPTIVLYFLPLAAILLVYLSLRKKSESRSIMLRDTAIEAGLTEPASLHPIIDPAICLGCGACVNACPEGRIIGLIKGKAQLIEPTHCIGHGACAAACPFDAITLVFGTEKRGMDIPHVGSDFQTNVPGIFIAGELGGMGLIRNAIEQGRQAMASIRTANGAGIPDMLDVLIVGAGPAGFSASLAAMEAGLNFLTVDQDSLGGTVSHYPRGKLVMTAPATLPLVGKVRFRETNKEALMGFWQQVEAKTGLTVNYHERVEAVSAVLGGFHVQTNRNMYQTRTILLAIGRRGTPRKLNVPGEEQTKVVYRLIDPAQYRGHHVLVVGGGDSALEAAISIADEPGTTVSLSYRNDAFGRAKLKNRQKVDQARAAGRLNVLLKSNVKNIDLEHVELEMSGEPFSIANNAVIICAGGILPTRFLKDMGVTVDTKFGTA